MRKLAFGGEETLNHPKYRRLESKPKILMVKNETLKILLAEKEHESWLKEEILKKKYPDLKKKN